MGVMFLLENPLFSLSKCVFDIRFFPIIHMNRLNVLKVVQQLFSRGLLTFFF